MIYDEPKFLPGGDRYIEMELGDELNFDLNFLVHSLSAKVREAEISGLIELLPNMASIVLSYDPDRISFSDLKREILSHYHAMGSLEDIELLSPIYYIPVLYCDHITRACWEDYCAKIGEKEYDPDLMVRLNDLDGYAQLIRIHSGTEYWVSALGFYPGLASLIALDPRCRMTAPKYNPPR
ncbi:MAG: carboxyltransferase domain-containing protein, partial [Alphaproteobacteria bacterium]